MCTRILKFDFVWDELLDACDGAIYLGKSSPFFNPSAPPWATVKLWTYVTCTFVGMEKPKDSASGRAKNTVPCGTSKPHDRKQDEKGRDRQASKKASSYVHTLWLDFDMLLQHHREKILSANTRNVTSKDDVNCPYWFKEHSNCHVPSTLFL